MANSNKMGMTAKQRMASTFARFGNTLEKKPDNEFQRMLDKFQNKEITEEQMAEFIRKQQKG